MSLKRKNTSHGYVMQFVWTQRRKEERKRAKKVKSGDSIRRKPFIFAVCFELRHHFFLEGVMCFERQGLSS
jgi:hypothetical protein